MPLPPPHPGREKMARLARLADRVSVLILREDYPDIDLVLAVDNLRETALGMFPGRGDLFEMIYASRFRRLWSQFRTGAGPPF
ncbi:MAG: hypothetical protein J7M19_02370 [Planctomycetes bacterium]|nr:hypothetical protein [Planctomycetota bacterium]